MAMIFALSSTMLVVMLGSAMDYSTLSSAYKQSQNVADTTALNAAIFVKNNDRLPKNSDEGFVHGHTYSAAEIGEDFRGWVEGGAENVHVTVHYDDNAKEARVTVTGATVPSFMQVTGKDRLPFSAESVVSYLEVDEKFPASIALILDNSGSMAWDDKFALNPYKAYDSASRRNRWFGDDPGNSPSRMAGLRTSVSTFTSELKSRLGSEDSGGRKTIRMGMLPYNDAIITTGERPMTWGYIQDGWLNAMRASGATNSNPPMNRAKDWMEDEQLFHDNEATLHGEDQKDALKFVIFMTDGQNTAGNYEVVPGDTGYWYGQIGGRWYYSRSPRSGFTEGTLELDTDRVTIQSCQQMKNDDVQIFTIGYALETGVYNANSAFNDDYAEEVTEGMRSTAYSLLQSCASKPENFIKASDGESLEAAFDAIQNAIVEELIRIKS